MTETAVVTGSEGFAGAWLCRALLEEDFRVIGVDREPKRQTTLDLLGIATDVERVHGDVRDTEFLERTISAGRVEAMFHLAAMTLVGEAQQDPLLTFDTNVRGTFAIVEACRRQDVARVIVASSDKAYGPSPELPYREDMPLRPIYPYDASKAAAELLARSYSHTYGLPVAITRFANLYGGGDLNFSRLVPEAVCAALDGRRPVLRSDGTPERDFLYVEDAARAYLRVAEALAEGRVRGEAFNAGGGKPYPVGRIVALICEIAGSEVEPDIQGTGTPEGEIDRQWLDPSKIQRDCGWRAEIDLREGLERTIEWYRSHPEARPAPSAVSA